MSDLDFELIEKYDLEVLKKYSIVPIKEEEVFLLCATYYDDLDLQYLEQLFCKPIKLNYMEKNTIEIYLKNIEYKLNLSLLAKNAIKTKTNKTNNSYISDFLKQIVLMAIDMKSSDIHIETNRLQSVFRFRIDGKLNDIFNYDKEFFLLFSAIIKLRTKLDVSQKRIPQDGRFSLELDGYSVDLRVSIIPLINLQESIVIRILKRDQKDLNLDNLGLPLDDINHIKNTLKIAQGMVLVTGATGSGKTTTMYAMLNQLDKNGKKIITIEDPVEYEIEGITQINIDTKRGLTFANILRNILRQDPDVILIGEIRDKESLQIAIQAALTGHLVIATLHTNSAVSTLDRLFDLEAEPFLIANVLKLIISQKLVRLLCPKCKEKYFFKDHYYYKATGCVDCNLSGYKGRGLVTETLQIEENNIEFILNKETISIKQDKSAQIPHKIYEKVLQGISSLEEYYSYGL